MSKAFLWGSPIKKLFIPLFASILWQVFRLLTCELIRERESWLINVDYNQEFSSKPNGVFFRVRELLGNSVEFSFSPRKMRDLGP